MELDMLKLPAFLLVITIHIANGAMPGTYSWKPRLGIDLAIPTTESSMNVALPTKENVREGLVVLINTYQFGLSVVAMIAGISSGKSLPHMNPLSAYFYTNGYRWALRHFSLLPSWLGGHGAYVDTHKVWRRRFFYMDEIIPKWLRNLFPYVDKKEWEKEEQELKNFKRFAEPAFGKHYRFPTKHFNNFKSEETKESIELLEKSSSESDSRTT